MQKDLLNSNFKNVYYIEGEKPVFCYRFGETVYEEVFDEGRLVAAGWNVSGYTQNVMEGIPIRLDYNAFAEPQSFDVEIDGRSLAYDWQLADFEQREENDEFSGTELLHSVVTLKSGIMPVTAEVHTVLDGTSVMTRYITVTNESERTMNVSAISPMCGGVECINEWDEYIDGVPQPEKLYSLGYFESAAWGQEGLFRWHEMPNAGYSIFGRYRRNRHRHPMFMMKNNVLGNMFFAQLGWTGGYEMQFDLNAQDNSAGMEKSVRRSLLGFKIAIDSQKPMLVLDPGETFVSPSVHIGNVQGDLDDAVNAMHAHIRTSVFTIPAALGRKGWLEAGVGPERIMDFGAIKHITDTAAAVGAETIIIDAGWNCPLGTEVKEWWERVGDWYADDGKYGDGFAAVREYVHSHGMLFGLWMDSERIGPASAIYKEHPEWAAKRYVNSMGSSMIDMTNPDVAEWVEEQIGRLVEEYKIDLFRLDYNIDHGEIFNKIRRGSTDECGTIRYYNAVYTMYKNLRKKYPNVVFENCAGGGGRTDVEFVRNFTHTWVSDWQIAPRGYSITNGMTMVLPPETVDRLASGMNSHTRASLDFQIRHTLFGRPTTNTYNARGSEFNPEQIAFVKHSYDIYKEFIRPYMVEDGKIYHHTPESWGLQPAGTGILERTSADGTKGIIGIFNLVDCKQESVVVYPRGLDESKDYEVTFDNKGTTVTVSGYSMVNDGIRVRLAGSLTSELIIYKAID